MTAPSHVLVVGAGLHVPRVLGHLREISPTTRTSLLAPIALLPRIWDAPEHGTVVGLHDDESPAVWTLHAKAIHDRCPVDSLLCLDDRFCVAAAEVAAALNLPWHSPETVIWSGDKCIYRERLQSENVESVVHANVDSAEDVVAFGTDHGWPIVLKPAGGTGSVGVSKLAGPGDADRAFQRARASWPGQLVVEEWLQGDQYSVDALSINGDHLFLPLVRKFSDTRGLVEVGHLAPAPLPDNVADACLRHVTSVLHALGVSDGSTSTEFVLTPEGPRAIETHLRPSGGELPLLIQTAAGIDTYRQIARALCRQPVDLDDRSDCGWAALWQAFPDVEGTLREVVGLESVQGEDGIVMAESVAEPGEEVTQLKDNGGRLAFVIASADSPEEATVRARAGAESIDFVVQLKGKAAAVC